MSRNDSAPTFVETLESRTFLCGDLSTAAAPLITTESATVTPLSVTDLQNSRTTRAAAVNPFGVTGAGTKLKFKKTTSFPGDGYLGTVYEGGTFTDDKGHNGTYQLVLPGGGTGQGGQVLNLTFKNSTGFAGASRGYNIQFTPASKRLNKGLNGKTVTFSASASGSEAKGMPSTSNLKTIYLNY